MKIGTSIALAAVAAAFVTAPAAAAGDPEKAATHKIKKMDTDGDGSVSLKEFEVFRKAWVEEKGKDAKMAEPKSVARAFGKIDADGDGKVTHAEFVAQASSSESE